MALKRYEIFDTNGLLNSKTKQFLWKEEAAIPGYKGMKEIVDEHNVRVFDIVRYYKSSAEKSYNNIQIDIVDNISYQDMRVRLNYNRTPTDSTCCVLQAWQGDLYRLCLGFFSWSTKMVAPEPWAGKSFNQLYKNGEFLVGFDYPNVVCKDIMKEIKVRNLIMDNTPFIFKVDI